MANLYRSPLKVVPGVYLIYMPEYPFDGYTSIYLLEGVKGEKPCLVDTGYPFSGCLEYLSDNLNLLGYKLSDIGEVLLTHSHIDHVGVASLWEGDAVFRGYSQMRYIAQDFSNSISAWSDIIRELIQSYPGIKSLFPNKDLFMDKYFRGAGDAFHVSGLNDKEVFRAAGRNFLAIHTPGHDPMHLCFLEREHNWMFSGDMLLPGTCPIPIKKGGNAAQYLTSLAQLEKDYSQAQVFPGHGKPSKDIVAACRRSRNLLLQDINRTASYIRDADRETVQIIRHLAPDNPTQRELETFCQSVLAYLDYLEQEGIVGCYYTNDTNQQYWYYVK